MQVMSAQEATAALQNGVGSRNEPTPDEATPQLGSASDVRRTSGERQPQSPEVPVGQVPPEHCEPLPAQPLQGSDTTAGTGQAEPKVAPTILEPGGRLSLEQQTVEQIVEASAGFVTPKSSGGQRGYVAPTWMSGIEVPRWMMRLGSLLNNSGGLTTADIAPSPLPGGSPLYPSPPGSVPFRLRSPARARPISAVPTPPSSSSISAEAIQAEVQRQLHGVMVQLREYGLRNEALQTELEQTRAELQESRRAELHGARTVPASTDLLGGFTTAQLDPGALQGNPTQQVSDDAIQGVPGGVSGFNLQHREPYPLHPSPGVPGPTVQQGGDDQRLLREPRLQVDQGIPQAEPQGAPDRPDQAPGLLRSWWGNRPRSQTPPPRSSSREQTESHTLDVLSKGIQQLQELTSASTHKRIHGIGVS